MAKQVPYKISYLAWLGWTIVLIVPLLFYPAALASSWISSSDVHASLEFFASVAAIISAGIVLIHFFATGKRFFLLISLGFTLQGTEDLIHAIFSFSRIWDSAREGMLQFVPGTYVAGRLVLVICLLSAWYIAKFNSTSSSANRWKEAVVFNAAGFILGAIVTLLIINSPLPKLILPGQLISRPVDFMAALLYLATLILFIKRYRDEKNNNPFMWCMIASIITGLTTQIYMIHSQYLFDAQFDISHILKIFSYIFPIFGISVGTLSMFRREVVMKENIRKSAEREKQLAAKAAKVEAEKQKSEELKSINKALMASEGKLKNANQELSAKEQALLKSQEELSEKVKNLEKINKFMVGREIDMVNLKNEINNLLEEKGQPKKYKIEFINK